MKKELTFKLHLRDSEVVTVLEIEKVTQFSMEHLQYLLYLITSGKYKITKAVHMEMILDTDDVQDNKIFTIKLRDMMLVKTLLNETNILFKTLFNEVTAFLKHNDVENTRPKKFYNIIEYYYLNKEKDVKNKTFTTDILTIRDYIKFLIEHDIYQQKAPMIVIASELTKKYNITLKNTNNNTDVSIYPNNTFTKSLVNKTLDLIIFDLYIFSHQEEIIDHMKEPSYVPASFEEFLEIENNLLKNKAEKIAEAFKENDDFNFWRPLDINSIPKEDIPFEIKVVKEESKSVLGFELENKINITCSEIRDIFEDYRNDENFTNYTLKTLQEPFTKLYDIVNTILADYPTVIVHGNKKELKMYYSTLYKRYILELPVPFTILNKDFKSDILNSIDKERIVMLDKFTEHIVEDLLVNSDYYINRDIKDILYYLETLQQLDTYVHVFPVTFNSTRGNIVKDIEIDLKDIRYPRVTVYIDTTKEIEKMLPDNPNTNSINLEYLKESK